MALANYTDLQTAVADWSHRTVAQVTTFIQLAEERINSDLLARLSETEATLTGVVDSSTIPLPTGYIYQMALWREDNNGNRYEVIYDVPENLNVDNNSTVPRRYTINGGNIEFNSPNNAAYTYIFRYKKGFDIASTTTNDVLTNHPSMYLYGALVEAAMFARDFEILDRWEARYQAALQNAIKNESMNKSGVQLQYDSAITTRQRSNIFSGDL